MGSGLRRSTALCLSSCLRTYQVRRCKQARRPTGWSSCRIRGSTSAFAASCGLAVAILGVLSHGQTYGTGYDQARGMVEATTTLPASYGVLKFLATVISYISGIPGGLFAPSLSVGAALGQGLSHLLPAAPAGAVVLLGMVGYFSGVVQAPITSAVIVMEMTDDQRVTVPLLATSFLAFGVSRLICHRPLYTALAHRFAATQQRLPDC